MMLVSLMFFLLFITKEVVFLFIAMFIYGIGRGMRAVATASLVSEFTSEPFRGIALSIFWNMFDIGTMSGAILGGSLVSFLFIESIFSICCTIFLISMNLIILLKEK